MVRYGGGGGLEGVLKGSLGRLKHGLAGGEGGEAPLDLQRDVLEDMGRVVGLPVDIVDDLLRLYPCPVSSLLEVQEHIEEVGDLEVRLDLQAESVPGKDLPHLLAGLLHLSGVEGADTQEVVAVEAALDLLYQQIYWNKMGTTKTNMVQEIHKYKTEGRMGVKSKRGDEV